MDDELEDQVKEIYRQSTESEGKLLLALSDEVWGERWI